MLTDNEAFKHPSYEDGVANAVRRAGESTLEDSAAFAVYYDGAAIYVRSAEGIKPPNSKLICIAQRWDRNTVQMRFDGAKSEWRKI